MLKTGGLQRTTSSFATFFNPSKTCTRLYDMKSIPSDSQTRSMYIHFLSIDVEKGFHTISPTALHSQGDAERSGFFGSHGHLLCYQGWDRIHRPRSGRVHSRRKSIHDYVRTFTYLGRCRFANPWFLPPPPKTGPYMKQKWPGLFGMQFLETSYRSFLFRFKRVRYSISDTRRTCF